MSDVSVSVCGLCSCACVSLMRICAEIEFRSSKSGNLVHQTNLITEIAHEQPKNQFNSTSKANRKKFFGEKRIPLMILQINK